MSNGQLVGCRQRPAASQFMRDFVATLIVVLALLTPLAGYVLGWTSAR